MLEAAQWILYGMTYLGHLYVQVDPGIGEDLLSCTLTPLMAAAQCGHVEVVQELLRGGAKLEVKMQATRWTALMFAALNNKVSGWGGWMAASHLELLGLDYSSGES